MDDIKNRRFRQLRKSHAWVSVIVFFFVFIITAMFSAIFISSFAFYVIEDKINEEYEDISFITSVYEKAQTDGSDPYRYIDDSDRKYIIFSSDGTELFRSEGTTITGNETPRRLHTVKRNIKIIPDPDTSILIFTEDDECVVNILGLISGIRDHAGNNGIKVLPDNSDADGFDPDDLFPDESDNDEPYSYGTERPIDFLHIPLWIVTEAGGNKLVTQAFISLNLKDMTLFAMFFVLLSIIMLTIFVILIVNIISSITRRNRLLEVFFADVTTGGHNWLWFVIKGQQLIGKSRNRSKRYAVVNVVFVNYRNFCVCHSVREGDIMLRKVHTTLKSAVTKKEMCAHCTSSNYALLMEFTDRDAFERRMRSMLSLLEGIDSTHKFAFHAGVSVIEPDGTAFPGGIIVRRKNVDLEIEYNNACTARATLEASDDSGLAFFDMKLIEDQKWLDAVQEKQASALANEEFLVFYQPKYDPCTDTLRGAEALIRWQSPDFGFVPPGRIIPIYEKNGFITEIDHYMVSHVARDQKAWLDSGCKCVPVSVNVSRAHFIESDLAEQIRDMVDKEGCPHDLIEIELTESAFFDDKKAMISTISKLKEYGFAVSMDDFGSGYSSLNSLKDMPLDVLKLDADFFRGTSSDGRGEIVVAEAIKLAKSLNMRTVAEGVEVRDQVDFLAAQGCDMIQGYYYAKPMPKNEFEQRMASGSKNAQAEPAEPADISG